MKLTPNRLSVTLIVAGLLGFPHVVAAACSKTIIVAYDDWIPYTYLQENGSIIGLDAEIIAEMMMRAGCDYQFKSLPSKRAFAELKDGSVDMLRGATVTEERKALGWFTYPYRNEEIRLMIRKGEADKYPLENLKSIIGRKINISTGQGWYGPEYGELKENESFRKQLLITHSNIQRVKMLIRNRTDMLLGDPISMIHSAKTCCSEAQVELHPLHLYDGEVSFLLSYKSLSLSDKETINTALLSMKQDGSLDRIISRYSLK